MGRADWIKGLFKSSNKKEETSSTTAKTETKELDWKKVLVKEDESVWDKVKDTASQLWSLVWNWYSETFGDAQDVEDKLYWLRYKDQAVPEEKKKDYLNALLTLENLKKKQDPTSEDLATIVNLDSELQNYTVPENFDEWFFTYMDKSKNDEALKSTAKRVWVDTKYILWKLWEEWSYARQWLELASQDEDAIQTMTKKQYEDELKDTKFNDILKQAKQDAANKMANNWYIAYRNPGGRKSTVDEVLWDLEDALNDRSSVQTLEAYKILYRYLQPEDAPNIKQALEDSAKKIVDVNSYILSSNKTSKEALVDYVNEYWNPFTIDLSGIPSDQMTSFEQDILNASLLWRPEDLFNDRYTENSHGADWYAMANQLLRQVQIRQDIENGDNLQSLWHSVEYNSAVLWGYMSAWIWSLFAWAEMLWEVLSNKDITREDYNAYLYWWQNSTYMNLKERHQKDFSNIDYLWSSVSNFVADYWSVVDDIATAYLEAKVVDLPIKAATLRDINSVISKWSKIAKATETSTKVVNAAEKTAEAWEKIVTTWEKINNLVKSQTLFQRIWNGIKNNLNNWWNTKKSIIEASWSWGDLSAGSIVRLSWQNTMRWLTEETMTSALMQWLTPYDYEQTDLIMDIWWALFSGLTRAIAFNNWLWILKLQSNSSAWVSWWLRDVQKLSDIDTERVLNKLSATQIEELWNSIKWTMWFIWEETQKISRSKAKTKAQQLSNDALTKINDTIKKLSDAADQKIMNDFANSLDPNINKLVKKKRVKWEDGKYRTQLVWNWDIKNKNFARKVEKARSKLYWWLTVDDASTVWKMAKKIAAIKEQVWKNVKKKAKKKWLSKAATEALYQRELKATLKKYWLDRYKVLNKWAKETFMGIWPMDEINALWPMSRRLAIYINNFILMKKAGKMDLIRGLSILWKETRDCFMDWIQKSYPTKWTDWDKYTKEELVAAIKEFWLLYDEVIFPNWNLWTRTSKLNWVWVKKPWTYIAEWSYEDATKANPELKFMWESLFREIADDPTLTLEQKETKFLNYRRTDTMSGYAWGKRNRGQHIYGIDNTKTAWFGRKTFNDTYEEKQVFWQEWTIYLKIDEEDWATVINNYNKQWVSSNKNGDVVYNPEPFDRTWTLKCTYKKQPVNSADWHSEYFVYNEQWIHVATIRVDADVDFSQLWKKPAAKNIYPKPRNLSVTLLWDLEWNSVEFEVVKDPNSIARIFPTDIDLTIKEDTVVTSETYKNNWRTYKRTSTLWQWNKFSRFIARGETSYTAFRNLIPWYTDRVPESYFNRVMKSEWLSPVDKQNLLMAMMVNKWINITDKWVSVKTWRNVFRRPAYDYTVPVFDDKWKVVSTQRKHVRWDAEMFMSDHREWTILFTRPDGTVEAYYYVLSDNAWTYHLYKDLNDKAYVWDLVVWEKSLWAYVMDGKKRIWANNVEFLDSTDLNNARKTLWERYGDISNTIVKVPSDDEMFREIYRKLYWAEMSEEEYHKLRSTPNMTPERYLNQKLQEFRNSRFWRYIPIKKWNWESVAQQIWAAQYQIKMAELFVNMYPESALTDAQIMWAVRRLIDERMSSWGKVQFKFTKSEREIADIMFDKNKKTFSDSELISIYWYSMYWKEPEKMVNSKTLRLRNRRNNILLALFKDKKVLDLTDWEKEMLVNWAKRKWLMEWTEEELINDILKHPETYRGILQALSKSIEEAEKLADTTKEVEELAQVNKRLQAIEPDVVNSKKRKKVWANTNKIQKEISKYQKSEVDSLLEQAKQEIDEAAELWDETKMNAAYSKREELEEYNERYAEEQQYKDTVNNWGYTEDQFDFLAQQRMRWKDTNLIQEKPLSQAEVNARIKDITDRMPWLRVVTVDPVTWKVDFRWFTKEEQLKYEEQLKVSTQAVLDWRANAAHVRELHAIVVNPRLTLSNTLWHEWFHEAVYLMQDSKWTPTKIDNLFYNTFKKHQDDIEMFAAEKWYDVEYRELRNLSASEYQRAITEEWLAERFWEYVNNRYNEALGLDSDLAMFFKDLWERMQLMFSDTNAMELFEDIYEWRIDYWDVTIDLKASDMPTTKFSLLSDDAKSFFDSYDPDNSNIWFWDRFNEYTIDILRSRFRLSSKDLKVWTSNGLVGRWAFAAEIKTTLKDWTRASFNELYESMSKKAAVTAADNLTDYIYGREFVWDFYDLTEDVLLELKTNWNITRQWNGFKVQMETKPFYPMSQMVQKNKAFTFRIWMWESELFKIDNTTDFMQPFLEKMPDDLQWKDWYQAIMREIMRRLNDSWTRSSRMVSRTQFYHKISKEIQSSRTLGSLFDTLQTTITPRDLDRMTEALENGIRKWCKQVMLPEYENLPKEVQQVMHEAYVIYLFNQFIPHGDKTTDLVAQKLFSRKNELTIRLLDYINRKAPEWVSYYIYYERKQLPTLNFTIDLWDWTPRYIWWHLPKDFQQVFEEAGLKDLDINDREFKRVTVWNKSLLNTSTQEYKNAVDKMDVDSRGKEYVMAGKSPRMILEEAKPQEFADIIHYQKAAIINWDKVIFGKDASDAVLKAAYEKGFYKPVTLISDWRHKDNIAFMNKVHKKYNISIQNASPKTKEKLASLKEKPQKNIANRREILREYEMLNWRKSILEAQIRQKDLTLKAFQEWQIYQTASRIKNALDTNGEAYKAVKEADDATIISNIEDVYTPTWELNWVLETTMSTQPPFGKMANLWKLELDNPAMKDWVDNLKTYQDANKISGIYSDEIDIIRKHSWMDPDEFTIYPVRDGDICNEIIDDMMKQKWFAIWAENSKVLNDWKNSFDWDPVYERGWDSNIMYYRNPNYIEPKVYTENYTKESTIAEISNIKDLDRRLIFAEDYLWSVNTKISKTSSMQEFEELSKEKSRIEYLIEKTKDEMTVADDLKYADEWQDAVIWVTNDSSLICKL